MLTKFLLALALLELGVSPLVVLGQDGYNYTQLKQENSEINAKLDTLLTKLDTLLNIDVAGLSQYTPALSCSHISPAHPANDYYWVRSSNGTAVRVYCNSDWLTRVAYLNMTDPTHQCPSEWREITRTEDPRRLCQRTNETLLAGAGCSSATFSTHGLSYSHVCGRIVGYQSGSTDAFEGYNNRGYTTLDSPYVEGVVITHGMSPIEHIWTFAAALYEGYTGTSPYNCPCTNINNPTTILIPPFVGDDYFCETGVPTGDTYSTIFYPDDPLWDGQGCGPTSTCCEFNNPPYFCKQLPETTTDDIEVRICASNRLTNEDSPIEIVELYAQ